MFKSRIFLAGVGGQGTLTATNLLGLMAVEKGVPVVCGEVHGMAQRGGSVESYVLLGGYRSPKIDIGEADVLLGFEPLEGLRYLQYLKKDGWILLSQDPIYPPEVSLGKRDYPDISYIEKRCKECTKNVLLIPALKLAKKTKSVQTGNIIMLAFYCMLPVSLFEVGDLIKGIKRFMPEKIQDVNLKAVDVAVEYAKEKGLEV